MFPTEMLLVGLFGFDRDGLTVLGRKASTSKSVRSITRDPSPKRRSQDDTSLVFHNGTTHENPDVSRAPTQNPPLHHGSSPSPSSSG